MTGLMRRLGVAAMRAQKHPLDSLCGQFAVRWVAVMQCGKCAVQEFVRQAARKDVEHGLGGFAACEQAARALDFMRLPLFALRLQTLDQRYL
ncbi:hypothetical protein GALL_510410 [mine drainage metagenome]|uniref:Uncharacterized protein n=1 Tax=mine drainage metagenome TaxID=410659 RepID=A0A1J5P839_9ZZZZ